MKFTTTLRLDQVQFGRVAKYVGQRQVEHLPVAKLQLSLAAPLTEGPHSKWQDHFNATLITNDPEIIKELLARHSAAVLLPSEAEAIGPHVKDGRLKFRVSLELIEE